MFTLKRFVSDCISLNQVAGAQEVEEVGSNRPVCPSARHFTQCHSHWCWNVNVWWWSESLLAQIGSHVSIRLSQGRRGYRCNLLPPVCECRLSEERIQSKALWVPRKALYKSNPLLLLNYNLPNDETL